MATQEIERSTILEQAWLPRFYSQRKARLGARGFYECEIRTFVVIALEETGCLGADKLLQLYALDPLERKISR